MRKAFVIVGLGFGDEGKGISTDFLCLHHPNPLVIRHNGGQQAGHTVVTSDGRRHVFSNFGSGTLRGVPTYWSSFCTFSPGSFLKEFSALQALGVKPRILVDNLCAVTTHYEVLYNRTLESARGNARHGSCGMGFGATIERQLSPVKLFAQDLLFPEFCLLKLKAIREYYRQKLQNQPGFDFDALDHDAADQHFLQSLQHLHQLMPDVLRVVAASAVLSAKAPWETLIFEGAQGVLLDMDFGFFPHVTRSNTCSKNAIALLKDHQQELLAQTEIFYITRAYQTRHGQGPMTNEHMSLMLVNNEKETNQYNEHQGVFRVSPLDVDLLNYALHCDDNYSHGLAKNLMITCVDQLDAQQIPYFEQGVLHHTSHMKIPALLSSPFQKVQYSFSDCAENIACIEETTSISV